MFKRTRISSGVLLALGGALLAPATTVFAQADTQRIEITGSNIRRADTETASPVQVITKQEIDQSGKGTVAEYLQTLTADGQGSVPFTYGRGFSGATSAGISLRGLGANATLVLINGRRVTTAVLADDAQRTYVDLNQIPLEAVERVEVLKDGASSIYGSDAVAGVVNIILKKNFVGTIGKVSYGVVAGRRRQRAARGPDPRLRRPGQGRLQPPAERRSSARRTRSSIATASAAARSACRPSASRNGASIRTRARPTTSARRRQRLDSRQSPTARGSTTRRRRRSSATSATRHA